MSPRFLFILSLGNNRSHFHALKQFGTTQPSSHSAKNALAAQSAKTFLPSTPRAALSQPIFKNDTRLESPWRKATTLHMRSGSKLLSMEGTFVIIIQSFPARKRNLGGISGFVRITKRGAEHTTPINLSFWRI